MGSPLKKTLKSASEPCFRSLFVNSPSVFRPPPISTGRNCRIGAPPLRSKRLKTAARSADVEEMFFNQLEDFCRLVQQEFLARFNEVKEIPNATSTALAFAETLILCPTQESTQACIRRELEGALSFVLAIQNLQRQLQSHSCSLPSEVPEYQTCYYLLASTVQEYLEKLREQPA